MFEARRKPERTPGVRSAPNAGSKRGSPGQSKIKREKRVRCVCVSGVSAMSSPMLESTAAWLCLPQKIHHAHLIRA